MLQIAGVANEPGPRLGRGEDVAERERRRDTRSQHALGGVANEVTSGLHHDHGHGSAWRRASKPHRAQAASRVYRLNHAIVRVQASSAVPWL